MWLENANPDGRALAGAAAMLEAARAVDRPSESALIVADLVGRLRHGWDGETPEMAVVHNDRGRVVGVLEVWLPLYDNRHLGFVDVTVDPAMRRQGLGRRLFEAGVDRVRAAGRTLVLADCQDRPAGVEFLTAMGLERASVAVQRRLDMLALDWARLDVEYKNAETLAADYELLRFFGRTPPDMAAEIASMTASINDAPTDDLDVEDEVFSPERIVAFEESQAAQETRLYHLVARHRATGELAGHTVVGIDSKRPGYGGQFDTSVVRAHRGHRLGLLLKLAMLQWLAEEEPQVRTLDTFNAASNGHMIRVNEILGYEVLTTVITWQRRLEPTAAAQSATPAEQTSAVV
jgi:GNAT superfamily N-acetyltransferase/L-amino acid N-acyltransferase YncA